MTQDSSYEPASDLTPGKVVGSDGWAVGKSKDEVFAVSRRCRHLGADLANGSVNKAGCLVCPWHGASYDTKTGRMIRGPQGIFAKIPGLGFAFKSLTKVLPLRVGHTALSEDKISIRRSSGK